MALIIRLPLVNANAVTVRVNTHRHVGDGVANERDFGDIEHCNYRGPKNFSSTDMASLSSEPLGYSEYSKIN